MLRHDTRQKVGPATLFPQSAATYNPQHVSGGCYIRPDISAMQTGWHRGLMAPFDAVADRAKAKGEMPLDRSASDLVAATVGPLFYRRWFSRESIDDRFVNAIVDAAVGAVPR